MTRQRDPAGHDTGAPVHQDQPVGVADADRDDMGHRVGDDPFGLLPDRDDPPRFEAPGNIVVLTVDKSSGAVLPAETPDGISEAFIAGTEPGANTFTRAQ